MRLAVSGRNPAGSRSITTTSTTTTTTIIIIATATSNETTRRTGAAWPVAGDLIYIIVRLPPLLPKQSAMHILTTVK